MPDLSDENDDVGGHFFYVAPSLEERAYRRLAESRAILLSWEEHRTTRRQLGKVADLQSAGLSLLTDQAIRVGTHVHLSSLSFLDFEFTGVVLRVQQYSDLYMIGIEFALLSDTAALQQERLAA